MFVHAWYVRHTPHQDYAEQVRTLQKIKEKLEIALEKHQDCTYFFSCFFNQIFLNQGPKLSMGHKSGKSSRQDADRIHQGIR